MATVPKTTMMDSLFMQMPSEVMRAYGAFNQAMWQHGRVPADLKEMIRMRSARLHDCEM